MQVPNPASHLKKHLATLVALALLILFSAQAILHPRTLQYPYIVTEVTGDSAKHSLTMLMDGEATAERCQRTLKNIASSIQATCSHCRINQMMCSNNLTPEQNDLLSGTPLDKYITQLPTGIIRYESANQQFAQQACEESEKAAAHAGIKARCYPAGTSRQRGIEEFEEAKIPLNRTIPAAFGLLLTALIVSCFTCWLIVRFEHLHAHFSHDHTTGGPQKYHAIPTPRIGGLALMAGFIAAGAAILVFESELQQIYRFRPNNYNLLLITSFPAFFGGMEEDVTKHGRILERLLLTMASGTFAAWLLGATINRIGIPFLDDLFTNSPFAILFTAIAVGGVANSINIIDGHNGLSSGYAIIVLAAFAWVSAKTHDTLLFHTSLTLIGALLGFLVWNWPKGKIFLGDGGAYMLGFFLAELAVLLVVRNPEISPWFPLLLLIYPVFETLFSIFRRRFIHNQSPSEPDNKHMHQLVYRRIVSRGNGVNQNPAKHNSRVAKYFWVANAAIAAMGVAFYQSTAMLIAIALTCCVMYVICYRRIA